MPHLGLPSFWQGVTGAIEKDETIVDAASRELLEETGISADIIEPVNYSYMIPMQQEWRHNYSPGTEFVEEHVFAAIMREQCAPKLSREHNEWKWYNLNEALRKLEYPENVEGLRRCINFVQRGCYGL